MNVSEMIQLGYYDAGYPEASEHASKVEYLAVLKAYQKASVGLWPERAE